MEKKSCKLLALITTCLFVFNCAAYAAPHNVYKIRVPEEIGQVKERYQGKSEEVVIHIQDAHTSLDAQQNLARIIEHLVTSEGVNTVTTEGAEGYLDYSFLRNLPGGDSKKEAVASMLRQGAFTGTEFAHITSERYFDLYGAESISLYEKNHAAFVDTLSKREEILDQIEEVENILNDLKAPLYSDQVASFDAEIGSYRRGDSTFFEYCGKLLMFAGKAGIDISQYVNFTMLLEAKSWEEIIEFEKVDEERHAAIKAVKMTLSMKDDALSKKKKDIFERELVKFESTKDKKGTNTTQFYTLLKNLAVESRIEAERVQNFMNFANYISIFARLDKGGLLLETKDLQREIENRLATSNNESDLIKLVRNIRLLKDIVELKVLPEDVEYYRANKTYFSDAVYKSFLEKNCSLDAHLVLLDEILPAVDSFYMYAEERSELMADTAIATMHDQNENTVSLVAGGYHTDGITESLKKKNVSYIVITPQINDSSENIPYVEQMMGAKMPFQMLLESAFNTIMLQATASLPQEMQDIVGFEVTRNTLVLTLRDQQTLAFDFADKKIPAEVTQLLIYLTHVLNDLNVDNYQWQTLLPQGEQIIANSPVAAVYEETVGTRKQYIVFYQDRTPPKVVQAIEFKAINAQGAFVPGVLNQNEELGQQIVAQIANELKVDSLATLPLNELVSMLLGVQIPTDTGALHLNLQTIPGEARNELSNTIDKSEAIPEAEVSQQSGVNLNNVSIHIAVGASDDEKEAILSQMTAPVIAALQAVDEKLEGRAQLVLLPSSYSRALSALGIQKIKDKTFNYEDIGMFYNPETSEIFMGMADFVNVAALGEQTVNVIDYQTGEMKQEAALNQLVQAVVHDIEEQELVQESSLPAGTIEEINRGNHPVADSGSTIMATRLADDLQTAVAPFVETFTDLRNRVVSGLLRLVPAVRSTRTDVKPAVDSVLAIYIDDEYMKQDFTEAEMIEVLARNIKLANPKEIIIGSQNDNIVTSDFIQKLQDKISNARIVVGEDAFVREVTAAKYTNKVVIARKYDGSNIYTESLASRAEERVVKVDLAVDITLQDKALAALPATFAAFNSLAFLNKETAADFGRVEGLLVQRDSEIPGVFEYGFSEDVVNVLDGQNFKNALNVVSGLMKQISARVAEQRIYEKTIELAA